MPTFLIWHFAARLMQSVVLLLLASILVVGSLPSPVLALDRSDIREAGPGEVGELKELFPGADVFSEKAGKLPHYRAYKTKSNSDEVELLGFVFLTHEVEPSEFAYASSIEMMVGLTLKGEITKVKMLRHIEPFGYFSIDPPEFVDQLEGKSILDRFEPGDDFDAVTGATITIDGALRVIRKSTRAIARQYLQEQKQAQKGAN